MTNAIMNVMFSVYPGLNNAVPNYVFNQPSTFNSIFGVNL